MRITIPDYYSRFTCAAGDCPDTCCAGWAILIDEKTKEKYRSCPGLLGNRLANSIDWKEGSFHQYRGRCAFLNEKNLCDLYEEAGPSMLCKTCRNYPRHIEEYENLREISLSLSCPEAAKLILSEDPVHFITREIEKRVEDYGEFDFFLFTKLEDAREVILRTLQDRSFDIRYRMGICLALSHDFSVRLHTDRLYETDQLLKRCQKDSIKTQMTEKARAFSISGRERYPLAGELLAALVELEVLNPRWPEELWKARARLYARGDAFYEKNRQEFLAGLKADEARMRLWQVWQEQLMVYFVYTYFCGAVYDERPYEKMKLAVTSTLIICEFAQALWQETGELSGERFLEAARNYSREVEHSDENLARMEAMVGSREIFQFKNLMRLIFS